MNFWKKIRYNLASALLFCLAWPEIGNQPIFIFFAFIPLLLLEREFSTKHLKTKYLRFVGTVYPSFLMWNIGTTYFIFFVEEDLSSRIIAAGITYLLNALFMAVIFGAFYWTKKRLGPKEGYISLLFYWLAFEYMHMHWEISWPWLNLGNVFANHTGWIQWYEYFGVSGGTVWILLLNLFIFFFILEISKKEYGRKVLIWNGGLVLLTFALPIIGSHLLLLKDNLESERAIDVLIIQPNINPYTEKFSGIPPLDQLELMLDMAEAEEGEIDFIVMPETALQESTTAYKFNGNLKFDGLWRKDADNCLSTLRIREYIENHPGAVFFTGAADRQFYASKELSTKTSRFIKQLNGYYDSFNSIWMIEKNTISIYHKSKLVPGVEKIPFSNYLSFLNTYALDLGGTMGSLGVEDHPKVLESKGVKIAPLICYESVFGDFTAGLVRKGAEVLFIVTNDGWWHDYPGYKQHLAYARLRAIETRRWVVRSANTGVSAIIDPWGKIVVRSDWWTRTSLRHTIPLLNQSTIFTTYGDILARVGFWTSLLLVLYSIAAPFKRKSIM